MRTSKLLKEVTLCALVGGVLAASFPTHAHSKIERQESILERAAKSHILFFGDLHGASAEEQRDSKYVLSLLQKLKKQAYRYLIIEQDKVMDRFIQRYAQGKISEKRTYLDDFPGKDYSWHLKQHIFRNLDYTIGRDLIRKAGKLGFHVRALDHDSHAPAEYLKPPYSCNALNTRDRKTFENIKRLILNKDPHAKIVIFYGLSHMGRAKDRKVELNGGRCKVTTLGYYLHKYTIQKGKKLLTVALPYNRTMWSYFERTDSKLKPDIIHYPN